MFISLSFCILLHCFYTAKIVKKLRIHQFYSLNPHFYIRSIHSPIKNTPKHQVYTLAKRFKTFFYAILLFKRHFSPPWLEPPNPQKQRSYRLFQPFSLVIRAIHSTWHEDTELLSHSSCQSVQNASGTDRRTFPSVQRAPGTDRLFPRSYRGLQELVDGFNIVRGNISSLYTCDYKKL